MEINWDKLLFKENKLDYYALTVSNGKIINNKAYYIIFENKLASIGDSLLDTLLTDEFLKCFSCGISKSNCEKFDFLIESESDYFYQTLTSHFSSFDFDKIARFKAILSIYSLVFKNHVLGTKRTISDSNLIFENVCLYFRSSQYLPFCRAKPLIKNLILEYLLDFDFVFPDIGNGTHLHMVALDFSDREFKLKFYFKFNGDYDFKNLEKCFKNTSSSKVVSDIIYCNGRIDIFQVALSTCNKITYNFYLRNN